MTSLIEVIKAKVDVVDEVGQVVVLRKAGKALQGLCPFHNERTPSFYVFAESQTWYCFGCHEGGDIFSFVEKQESLEFSEALAYLAEKAGVALENYGTRNSEEERETSAVKERLRKLNEDALLWFHQILLRSREADGAREYVKSRGISLDSVIAFSLGYAPDHRDGLCRYLLTQEYTERELINGGLAREREEGKGGGVYDFFRNRLIFPIRDMRGRTIGFGGRALGDGQPKYLNSPATVLFEKNSALYALDMAKDAIKLTGQVVIVEGYVDALVAHQYGTRQTVACIGSAITEKHIRQLKKLTKQVTLALDPDAAGAAATEHGIQEALKAFDHIVVPVPLATTTAGTSGKVRRKGNELHGMIRLEEQVDAEINVVQLPAGEDPDELIRRDFAAWAYAVSHPLPLVDYYFVTKTANLDLRQPSGKAEAAKCLLPVIGMISDRVKRDAYIQKLTAMIGVDERTLYAELQGVLRSQRPAGVTAAFSAPMGQGQEFAGQQMSGVRGNDGGRARESGGNEAEKEGDGSEFSNGQRQLGVLDKEREKRVQWEDYLIGLLLSNLELSLHVYGIIDNGDFAGTDTRELYRVLNSVYQRDSSSSNQPIEQLVPSALLATVARAQKTLESRPPLEGAGLLKAAIQCATRLKRSRLVQLNRELQYLLRDAQEAGDVVVVQQFQQQVLTIHRELRTIDSATHLQG